MNRASFKAALVASVLGVSWVACVTSRDAAFMQAMESGLNETPDTLKGGRVPPAAGSWRPAKSPPWDGRIECWSPMTVPWGDMAGRIDDSARTMIFAMSMDWLEPQEILAVMTNQEATTHVVKGSAKTSDVERGSRQYRVRTWVYEGNGEQWDGAVYLQSNSNRPGSFVFGSCAPRRQGEGPARTALLQMMDRLELMPESGLDDALHRSWELTRVVAVWRRLGPADRISARFEEARTRCVGEIRSNPGFENERRAWDILGVLASYNGEAVRLGPGYDREEVIRDLEKARTLGSIGSSAEVLGQAYLDKGEPQKALDALRPYLQDPHGLNNWKGYLVAGDAFQALTDRSRAVSAYRMARAALLSQQRNSVAEGPLREEVPQRQAEERRVVEARLTAMGEPVEGPTPARGTRSF